MIDEKKLTRYIKTEINPYGKPFDGTVFEFGNMIMDYIERMEKEPERKWIPVSERLPKPNKAVLICTNTGEIEVDYYGSCTKDFIGLKGTHMKAAAWQPLPEPYKAGDQE